MVCISIRLKYKKHYHGIQWQIYKKIQQINKKQAKKITKPPPNSQSPYIYTHKHILLSMLHHFSNLIVTTVWYRMTAPTLTNIYNYQNY